MPGVAEKEVDSVLQHPGFQPAFPGCLVTQSPAQGRDERGLQAGVQPASIIASSPTCLGMLVLHQAHPPGLP